ncbi:hypothetical protein LguiA_029742 [Lonicera macranthoides]
MVPSALCFTVYTHLHPTSLFPGGNSTIFHVPFFFKDLISSSIAAFHVGSLEASCTLLGIDT